MAHLLSLEESPSAHQPQPQHQHQGRVLEYRAASSLCELSDHICADLSTPRPANSKIGCSPWKEKKDEMKLQQFLHKMRKKSSVRPLNNNSKILRSLCSKDGESTNDQIFKPRYARIQKDQTQLKKFPSVFIRLMALKEAKTQPKQNSDVQMLTILRRKKDCTHSQIKKAVILQREQNHSIQVRRSQAEEELYKHQALVAKTAKCEVQGHSMYEQRVLNDGWKAKNIYSKSKPVKRSSNALDNKQNSMLPKKYDQQYQSRNPLTKLLYQKYVNTISMTHPIKQGRYK